MDMEELWSKTREVLRAEVNAVVYNSLLGSNNLVPALLDGDTLVLRVVMDNLKLLITSGIRRLSVRSARWRAIRWMWKS